MLPSYRCFGSLGYQSIYKQAKFGNEGQEKIEVLHFIAFNLDYCAIGRSKLFVKWVSGSLTDSLSPEVAKGLVACHDFMSESWISR